MEKENRKKIVVLIILSTFLIPTSAFIVQGEINNKSFSSITSSQNKKSIETSQVLTSNNAYPEEKTSTDTEKNVGDLQNSDNTPNNDDITSTSFGSSYDSILKSITDRQQNTLLILLLNHIKTLWLWLKNRFNIINVNNPEDKNNNSNNYTDTPDDHSPNSNDTVDNNQPTTSSVSDLGEPIGVSPYSYPRLSLGTQWLQDWLNKPGYGLQWLYQFQNIYTVTLTQEVYNVEQAARNAGHGDWVENTQIIYQDCFYDARDYTSTPVQWQYESAVNSPGYAIEIAIYENKIRGCDWFMRDIHGDKIKLWGNNSWAWDTTPNCAIGLWDGTFTIGGHQYSIGDTRGKTIAEWICSGFKENVIYNSLFAQAFDGIQSEDFPTGWLYSFNGQIPDPLHDGVGMDDYNTFTDYCKDTWNYITVNFWGDLARHGYITRLNGNGFRWLAEGQQNPWPSWQESFSGCKFEDFGKWGGWPNWNLTLWWRCYNWLEPYYHPLGQTAENDSKQGWDVSTLQINARNEWPLSQRQQWKRMGLAFTLMGDGAADCYGNRNDYYFCYFLRGGSTADAPEGIPQMQFPLGQAIGNNQIYACFPTCPLYYRQFHNNDTQKTYTVVVNIWNFPIHDIPARDGAWFEGDWPSGEYQLINF